MNKYLLDEPPLVIIPSLAKVIGLNKAIILQQCHYWIQKSSHEREGRTWFYKTYKEWAIDFPFWGDKTIRKTITELEKDGLLISGNFNKRQFDKTKWYTIDYDAFKKLGTKHCGQNDPSMRSNVPTGMVNVTTPIPDTTTDITTVTETREEIFLKHDDEVDKLANEFMELRGKGLILRPTDYQAIGNVLSIVPFQTSLELLRDCFKEYKPNRPGNTINAFTYCEKYILDKHQVLLAYQEAKSKEKARPEDEQPYQHRGRIERTSKQSGKSYEQAIRELHDAKHAWGG
ncbi:hypothetical protein [Alkalihalobacillus sp. LMS39]|uniref:hypothetical protein n=1 Tax=Alkalihalobacillus sp. LMS39 TaxID=2924032 RepID=UPI001FB4F64F|nr:hypothetical protein [Alkalihalobacillus sp. LMS39]UOE96055.1 hypothetical protein MM271_10840 [Alkalihalobacillus sp. LMS39]